MPIPDGYGVGIATGKRSGIVVLDFDTLEAFEAMAARLPETYAVQTGRGLHLYFTDPGGICCSASKLAPGVDVRGDGGFVVGAGSEHKSGVRYECIQDMEPACMPAWLLAELDSAPPPPKKTDNAPIPCEGEELVRRERLARDFAGSATIAIAGENGSGKLWDAALYLVRRLELPLDLAFSILRDHYNPRCEPPWSDQELSHKLTDARDRSDMPTGIAPEGWDPKPMHLSGPTRVTHAYTHTPGHNSADTKCSKVPFSELIGSLYDHPDWQGVLRYDLFRRRAIAVKPPLRMSLETSGLSNVDVSGVRTWFEAHSVAVGADECARAIECACQRSEFHPVKEYLAALPAGDPTILDALATEGLGSSDPMAPDLVRRFMVGAVRRILQPGCQVDTMPVLVGKQGARKTSFVRSLFGHEWSRSQMPDLASKDASVALAGFWGVELAELDRVLKAETSTVKEFLTRTYDDYRPPYGRTDLRFPRECVFVGTVNEWEFLRDPTGSRRFWPIAVERASTDWVEEHRDEVWAAAVALEAGGAAHWFDDESALEDMRQSFVETDAWHEKIAAYCKGKDWVQGVEVYTFIGGKIEQMDQRAKRRVGDTLRRLGCEPLLKWIDGSVVRGWRVPGDLAKKKTTLLPGWRKQ